MQQARMTKKIRLERLDHSGVPVNTELLDVSLLKR